ncbi:MAG: tRNA (N6-isopentenyl adenosine(37)-C2)-methylthiotransferase MiaB, partial [Opitutales bacterium]|nr:tRNA (N6-isopentenyl adenosine(37)-C2)-methylthiotransferase MiaB [Opitutales bacterium]
MKVYIRTYGCQMNDRDSEDIAVQFIERGWELTDDENQADVCIVNTCSVREQAEQKAIGKLG